MKNRIRLLVIVLILMLSLGGALAGPVHAQAGPFVGPSAMLNLYYSAINAGNYAAAYGQWLYPQQTYQQFVAGYSDTLSVEAHFGGMQTGVANTVEGRVPTLLIGYHRDGSATAYTGCYDLVYIDTTYPLGPWLITGANLQALPAVPAAAQIPQYLNVQCYERLSSPGYYDTVQQILVDYYAAINRQDYASAYNLWINPPQTFQQFAAGFADTTEVAMFYGAYQFSGSYTALDTGRIPVFLFGFHTTGAVEAFQGCFIVHFNAPAPPSWQIAGSTIQGIRLATQPTVYQISQALQAPCY